MDKEMKVILPTMMRTTFMQCEDNPRRLVGVEVYSQYEFTVEEALKHMIDFLQFYLLEDLMLHNINMRQLMREMGARRLVEGLCELIEPSKEGEDLKRELDLFAKDWEGRSLEEIDIQVLPTNLPFVVDGIEFAGLQELKDSVVRLYQRPHRRGGASTAVEPGITPQCFVGECREAYPKFDIYDFGDNRSYQNFIIRKTPIEDSEFRAIAALGRSNFCAITEKTPLQYLPLVYYSGDGGFMLVAQRLTV